MHLSLAAMRAKTMIVYGAIIMHFRGTVIGHRPFSGVPSMARFPPLRVVDSLKKALGRIAPRAAPVIAGITPKGAPSIAPEAIPMAVSAKNRPFRISPSISQRCGLAGFKEVSLGNTA